MAIVINLALRETPKAQRRTLREERGAGGAEIVILPCIRREPLGEERTVRGNAPLQLQA